MPAQNSPRPASKPAIPASRKGFALIITITLLAFLVLLLVGLSSVTRVETQVATNTRELSQARQNALYGLQIAIGQLQKYAGADQRITAPATTIFPSDTSTNITKFKDVTQGTGELYSGGTTLGNTNGYRNFATTALSRTYLTQASTYLTQNERARWDAIVQGFWNAGRNPHYVGVLDSSLRVNRARNPFGTPVAATPQVYENNPNTLFGEPKRDQIPVWLVSGVENYVIDQNAGTVSDLTGTDKRTEYFSNFSPTSILPDPQSDSNYIWLVNLASSANSTASVDGLDGRVKVKKQPILNGGSTSGYYGYWVGDESIKANFAVQDPFANATVGTADYRNRLQVPQRLGWERMTGFTGMSFNPNNVNDPLYPLFTKVITTNQIPLLDPTLKDDPNGNRGPLPRNFHHLTGHSRSLLTDTSLGGLKRDLTIFLKTGNGLNPNSSVADPTAYANNDSRFNAWNNGNTNQGFPGSSTNLPTWSQIRSWYSNQSTGGGAISPTADIAPILTYVMLDAGLSYDGGTKRLRWHWLPCVVLWNPYDVGIQSATYKLELGVSPAIYNFYLVNESPSLSELQQDAGGSAWTGSPTVKSTWKYIDTNGTIRNINIPANGPDSVNIPATGWESLVPKDTNEGDVSGQPSGDGTTDMFGRFYYKLVKDGLPTFVGGGNAPAQTPVVNKRIAARFCPNNTSAPDQNQFTNLLPLKFSINTAFDAGQAKVFTLNSSQIWNGTAEVQLSNTFDSARPASMYFDIAKVENGPVSSSGLRFYFDQISNAITSPTVKLTINGAIIMQALDAFGDIRYNNMLTPVRGSDYAGYTTTSDPKGNGDDDGDGVKNAAEVAPKFVSTWRQLYDTSIFDTKIVTSSANNKDSSIFPWGTTWIQPMTGLGPFSAEEGGIAQFAISQRQPAFSRFNIGAKVWDAHPLVDAKRNQDTQNNRSYSTSGSVVREGLTKLFYTQINDSLPWNSNQASGNDGYALITPKNNDGTYVGQTNLSVRNAFRTNSELLSLGQLQQVNLSRFYWQPAFPIGNSFAPSYTDREAIAGINSRQVGGASGSVTFAGTAVHGGGPIGFVPNDSANQMLDLSYLLNENLWERYFLSGLTGDALPTSRFPNSRLKFSPETSISSAGINNINTRAAFLLNTGALNVNSTSVEAWKALLTAFRNLKLGEGASANPADTMPVSRTLDPIQSRIDFTDSVQSSADIGSAASNKDYKKIVAGFRYLTDTMINRLAERIVDEVRLRGPFYSVSDFVNRRLVAPSGSGQVGSVWWEARTNGYVGPTSNEDRGGTLTDNHVDFITGSYDPFPGLQGLSGTLQRAIQLSGINGGVNDFRLGASGTGSGDQNDRVYAIRIRTGPNDQFINSVAQNWQSKTSAIGGTTSNGTPKHTQDPTFRGHIDTEHLTGAPAGEAGQLFDGTPGFVTQGDLLAMIGPALTARGDTFIVRTYGEAINPATGERQGRAWLEAVVQRTIEPVSRASEDPLDPTNFYRPTSVFGRKYKVVSFRWLDENEL